jgi:hypothetical protein
MTESSARDQVRNDLGKKDNHKNYRSGDPEQNDAQRIAFLAPIATAI